MGLAEMALQRHVVSGTLCIKRTKVIGTSMESNIDGYMNEATSAGTEPIMFSAGDYSTLLNLYGGISAPMTLA